LLANVALFNYVYNEDDIVKHCSV